MRNFMLCLKSKKVNFEDCLYLFLKTKQNKNPLNIYKWWRRKKNDVLFVLQMLCVSTCGYNYKAVIALGLSQLEFMLNYIEWKRMTVSYFSIAVQFIVWSGFFDSLFNEEKCLGWKGLSRFLQRLFLFNKSNLLMIWGSYLHNFGSSHKWDL